MRVIIISDFGHVSGGAAYVAIASARGLAEAGHEVVYACAVSPVDAALTHPNIEVAAFDGQNIWSVGSKLAALKQAVWNTRAEEFMTELLARQPRDAVIHIHQWSKAFSPSVISAAAKSELRVLVSLHDFFAFCPVGSYFDYRAKSPCQQVPMGAGCITRNCDRASYAHKGVRVARQWNTNRAWAACRDLTFIHVSQGARRVAERFLPEHAKHAVIENMIEAASVPPVNVMANRHLLFLGRFSFEKGVLLLAKAAQQANMPVRFVGEGELEADIRTINPEAEIRAWVPADQVAAEIAQARAVIVPSYFETGPLVAPQAWAMGVPVVLTDSTGAVGWLSGEEAPLIAKAGNAASLAHVLGLLADDALVSDMGAISHARYWADPFTAERHLALTLAAYG
ncbi:MAG: glycosyltransferase family 4 protein [Bosea sp. (in: a-proteobacteria)]